MISAVTGAVLLSAERAQFLLGLLDEIERILAERRDESGMRTPQKPTPATQRFTAELRRAVKLAGRAGCETLEIVASETQVANVSSRADLHAVGHDPGYVPISSRRAAEILRCTPANVRDLRERGKLSARRTGGRWEFDAREVERRAAGGS